nr:cytoplasmic phosphatidylinositol transfer protein 1-like [Paramormyrops kingsleyae]
MLMKEYRICMPLTVEEYRIGQLYMISKHSNEQSERGEGVEVVQNEPYVDPIHGHGQFTEKRLYLNSKLPSWARAVVPKIFYVTEKAWNYYPYTITEYTVSLHPTPRQSPSRMTDVHQSCYSIMLPCIHYALSPVRALLRRVCYSNGFSANYFQKKKKYCRNSALFKVIQLHCLDSCGGVHCQSPAPPQDLHCFHSEKTSRGPLTEGWRDTHCPIMCSYKLVGVRFEVWGLQNRVEQFVHKVVRDVLLLGHRQAFAWVDEWIDMTMEEVREYERATQEATNQKLGSFPPAISISEMELASPSRGGPSSAPSTPLSTEAPELLSVPRDRPRKKSAPETLTLTLPERRGSGYRLPSFFPWHAPPPAQPE